jgi:hypothetical protein
MEKIDFNKETLIKLWEVSVQNMNPDVSHDVSETPLISSYSIQLPSFLAEPILCNIQIFKLQGEKPKISIIVGNYIEFASYEITDDEFIELSQNFSEKNDIIELEIRNNLIQKAEKNLEILVKSI